MSAFNGNAASRLCPTGVPGCFPLGTSALPLLVSSTILGCHFFPAVFGVFLCGAFTSSYMSSVFPVCLNCPQSVGSGGIWFTDLSLHREALLCLICPAEKIFKAIGIAWAPSLSLQTPCFLIALTCWFRQRDKAGTPYTCWSNCKSVETSIASILFPKRNVLWKTALLPPCNFFRSLMRAGVEAMPTENN